MTQAIDEKLLAWNEAEHTHQCNWVHAVIIAPDFMFESRGNSGKHGPVCAGCQCHLKILDLKKLDGKTVEAAGPCRFQDDELGEECGAKVTVKLDAMGWGTFTCEKGHEEQDSVSWDYHQAPILFQGQYYKAFARRSNHAHCVNCGLIIYEIPLILWGPDAPKVVEWELNFCMDCVQKVGIKIG